MQCNIHRKTPVLESLFSKGISLRACNFVKWRLKHNCFPVNIAKFLKNLSLKSLRTAASVKVNLNFESTTMRKLTSFSFIWIN